MTLQLFNGDCLEVMATLPDKSVDCFICDLPYGCLAGARKQDPTVKPSEGRTIVSLPCAWDVKIDLPSLWKQIKRLAKNDHVPVLMFCTTKFGFELYASNPSWFRYDLVWDKGRGVSFLSANKMPMRSHEMVYVFSKKGAAYKRVDVSGGAYTHKRGQDTSAHYGAIRDDATVNTGTRCALSIVKNPLPGSWQSKGGHPTEKPKSLYHWLLERYCPAGGTVLDPTFGSCNSGRASRDLGLKYVGIEMDPTFFKKAHDDLVPVDEATIAHV